MSLNHLKNYLNAAIIGQPELVDKLLVALLSDGHLLVEGAPGLAKTRAIKLLANAIEGSFHRIQFTPDLLPADLTGTEVYRPQEGGFSFQQGPLFHHFILADEINRAPAKVQSALLEAMAERQITVGKQTYRLPSLFLVMATQNPIEHEGTYPLPEAQLDRFLLALQIDYPNVEAEQKILQLARKEVLEDAPAELKQPLISQEEIFAARKAVLNVHLSTALEQYLIQLIIATRQAMRYDDRIASWIQYGASPRATIALDRTARAYAYLQGRDHVLPSDIQNLAFDVLRHRLILSYEAQADGITTEHVINSLLKLIAVP